MKKTDPNSNANTLIRPLNSKGQKGDTKELIGNGSIEEVWNVNRTKILKFQKEIWHNGLKEH